MKVLIITFFIIFSNQAVWSADCLRQSDLRAISSKFTIQQWSNAWVTVKDVDLCQPDNFINKTISALIFLKELPTLLSEQDEFDRGVLKNSPFDFFYERVKTIRFDTNKESTRCRSNISGTLAYVLDSASGEMYVCPFINQFKDMQILGTLIHEARHLWPKDIASLMGNENAYKHSVCERGFFRNTFSCDTSLAVSGSYGVEMEFYLKLSRSKELPLSLRLEAHGILIDGLVGHFNDLPGGHLGMLLQSDSGTLIFYDEKNNDAFKLLNNVPATSIITNRFTPAIFDTLTGSVESYLGSNLYVKTNGLIAQKFRHLKKEKVAQLKDVVYGLKHQCMLFSDSLNCSDGDFDVEFKIPDFIKAKQFSMLQIPDRDLFFIVSEDGKSYMLPLELPINKWDLNTLEEVPGISNFLSAVIMPKLKRFGISMDGTFVSYEDPSELKPVKMFEGTTFKKIIAPFYWSKKIESLSVHY